MIKYKLFKVKDKNHPDFMHEIDEDNPTFVGVLDTDNLKNSTRIKLNSSMIAFVSSPIISVKETDEGYYVETLNSFYELRRLRTCGCGTSCKTHAGKTS